MDNILTVDLSRRLPDIDRAADIPKDLEDYGRCAVLRNGALWFAPVKSSHPASTREGFYWALKADTLYISPRGAAWRWTDYLTPEFINYLFEKLKLNRRFNRYRIVE